MEKYDLVIIGGGPAGTPVAMEYAKLNSDKKVAIIEKKGELGGECLFDGCIPSKIMEISAKHIKELEKLKEFGIELNDSHYQLIWEKIKARKESILDKRTTVAKKNALKLENLQILKAQGSFVSSNELCLTYDDDSTQNITFDHAVIATGSKAFIPNYKGNGVSKIWTNEDFFEKMELPSSLTIIGSGAIAIEFAQILSTLGVKINLISRGDSILKNIDKDFAKLILEEIQNNKNIELILNATVTEVNFNDEFEVIYTQNDKQKRCVSQKVLAATGRVANISQLALEKSGVIFDKKGIIVDKHLATNVKNIYANGDVVKGFPKFAHTSMYGAHTIAQNLFLGHNFTSVDYEKNSWVLFSSPNIAVAGISEDEAKEKNLDVLVGVYDYSIDAKFQIEGQKQGFLKFIVEKKSLKIIGVSAILEEANAIMGEGALIVAKNLTLSDLVSTIHPHPTYSESFGFLAKQMMGEVMVKKLQNPAIQTLLKIERFL